MAAQFCTTRTVKRWGGSAFGKIRREASVRAHESYNAKKTFGYIILAHTIGLAPVSVTCVKLRQITAIMRFKIIQGHNFQCQWKARIRLTSSEQH